MINLNVTLFVVFLVLKLVGVITWSWWWVTAPLWGPLAVVMFIFASAAAIGLGLLILSRIFGR